MRDAFGGVFMTRLMLVFIVLYVAFTAVSFKYAKSFRIKNKVIDFVEQNQIIDVNTFFAKGSGKSLASLDNVLKTANYDISCADLGYNGNGNISEGGRTVGYCYKGVVITKNFDKSTSDTTYYNVYTYVDWNLGAFNTILVLGGKDRNSEDPIVGKWRISGEAIVVYK